MMESMLAETALDLVVAMQQQQIARSPGLSAAPLSLEGWAVVERALRAYCLSFTPRPLEVTERMIDKALSARIPGGSAAEDWFLPHDNDRARINIRDVARQMVTAALTARGVK